MRFHHLAVAFMLLSLFAKSSYSEDDDVEIEDGGEEVVEETVLEYEDGGDEDEDYDEEEPPPVPKAKPPPKQASGRFPSLGKTGCHYLKVFQDQAKVAHGMCDNSGKVLEGIGRPAFGRDIAKKVPLGTGFLGR